MFFTADSYDGEVVNVEPHKCDDLSWFAIDHLPENTVGYIRSALENICKNGYYSEYGWE